MAVGEVRRAVDRVDAEREPAGQRAVRIAALLCDDGDAWMALRQEGEKLGLRREIEGRHEIVRALLADGRVRAKALSCDGRAALGDLQRVGGEARELPSR